MSARQTTAAALALVALALLPDAALACPVCFDASDENRKAFFATAVFLSLFPLGMVAGAGLWLRKRAREVEGHAPPLARPGGTPPEGTDPGTGEQGARSGGSDEHLGR